jgi:hypothetical protein
VDRVCCSVFELGPWFHDPTRLHAIITADFNSMTTPTLNFVAVCANANLPVQGNKNHFLKVLKESGAAIGSSQTLPDIKERFAALTWVRHAVAYAIAPASWPSTLSAPLLDFLRSLYPIPPQRSDAPAGETDLHRLANMVSLFLPADLSAASTTSASTSATNAGGGINTTRPPTAQQAPASASTASSSPQPAPTVINLTGKRRWMMHDEPHALLPDAVYTALDSNAHLTADKRFKLQEACKKSNTSALFDYIHFGSTYISTLRLDGVPPDLQWMASSLGALSPRSTIPVIATSRPLFTPRSRPQCHSGHVPRPGPARATWQTHTSSCCGATACPTGSRNGTGLDAMHPPRIWSLSPSDSLQGSVPARGHARLKPTWFPLKSSLSCPQWR